MDMEEIEAGKLTQWKDYEKPVEAYHLIVKNFKWRHSRIHVI